MSVTALRSAAMEVRNVVEVVRGELSTTSAGNVVVTGMLAEQLARELGTGAELGAVSVPAAPDEGLGRAAVAVHVIAGDPSQDDERVVRTADARGVPIVLVQLWPQAEWTRPYVLSPFVVECRAGEGFPVEEIAGRIAESVERPQDLAARIPVLREVVARRIVRESTVRAGLVGLLGGALGASRPLLAVEQTQMVSRLLSLHVRSTEREVPFAAGITAAGLGAGVALREVARTAGRALPSPLVNAAVAAGATWALGRFARRFAESDLAG